MSLASFEEFYEENFKEILDAAADTLEEKLEEVIKKYNFDKQLFRPRLVETRVKSPRSLFDKLSIKSGDEGFENFFDFNYIETHIKDIIGARIVCHNLCDVRKILDAIDSSELNITQPPAEEKFTECKANSDSGYRGLHRLIRWEHKNKKYSGEIQIRTLLQDAWASFMHDDIYEHGLKSNIPKELNQSLIHASDLFHSIDLMANELRNLPMIKNSAELSLAQSLANYMTGYISWIEGVASSVNYSKIIRSDTYIINGDDGVYDIMFKGETEKSTPFEFFLSGDTNSQENATINEFIDCATGKDLIRSTKINIDKGGGERIESPNLIRLSHNKKSKIHEYHIKCQWKGTFRENLEYLHIPWKSYYQQKGSYNLTTVFNRSCKISPQLFKLKDVSEVIEKIKKNISVKQYAITQPNALKNEDGTYQFNWNLNDFYEDVFLLWASK